MPKTAVLIIIGVAGFALIYDVNPSIAKSWAGIVGLGLIASHWGPISETVKHAGGQL